MSPRFWLVAYNVVAGILLGIIGGTVAMGSEAAGVLAITVLSAPLMACIFAIIDHRED